MNQLTLKDLQAAIVELRERFPKLTDDDLFVLWFFRAYLTDSEQTAAEAITGEAGDQGIDGLLIDDSARAVFIVQSKYRQKLEAKPESRSDVMAFGQVAHTLLAQDDEQYQEFVEDCNDLVKHRLREARRKLLKDGYRLWLYYVTTGSVSHGLREDVQQFVRRAGALSRIEVIGGKQALLLFRDYLDGVAPPIPTLDLEMESTTGVTVNGIAQRFDHRTKVESWVFSMRGDAVASLFEKSGLRLFARNIRGFLGKNTPVNEGMVATLKSEPERFFYYNNGVTIICDQAEKKSSTGRDILQVGNPQIINGQQTTRTLAAYPQQAGKATVLVKVIKVPRNDDDNISEFEGIVSKIVAGTNWQNAITPSDLMSNDRKQIEIERAFRKLGYLYLRKRQTKGEAKSQGGKQFIIIRKDELAQAVAGCELDPLIVRSGKERLFEEEYYDQIFPNADPLFYLSRYWLMREINWHSIRESRYGYAKWMVLNFMWTKVGPLLRSSRRFQVFRKECERQHNDMVAHLSRAILPVFQEAIHYYRENRGTGKKALDISRFFKGRKGHHIRFAEFWNESKSKRVAVFDKYIARFANDLEQSD